ncbi:hypothetical protein TRIP_E320007 [uncultured Spirochaetota bacterium]|nr:hypothetical protein TRIP_E320007 [uncultured Spirochaetota bacterium]
MSLSPGSGKSSRLRPRNSAFQCAPATRRSGWQEPSLISKVGKASTTMHLWRLSDTGSSVTVPATGLFSAERPGPDSLRHGIAPDPFTGINTSRRGPELPYKAFLFRPSVATQLTRLLNPVIFLLAPFDEGVRGGVREGFEATKILRILQKSADSIKTILTEPRRLWYLHRAL